jgi:hypothetical protein
MIGLDTSHVIAFTDIFQDPQGHTDLADIEIVAGFPGGTDLPISRDRIADFSAQLTEKGVEIVDSIPALLNRVDVVMLESVDGNVHLEQVIPVFESGLPVFIDKPLAGSLADAIEINRLAARHGVPCFSSSSIRYSPVLNNLCDNAAVGEILGAVTWGPCPTHDNIPDLFFYGIHGIEGLFTLMGRGCESVQRSSRDQMEVVVGTWSDGRIGTYHGIRKAKAVFGATVFGAEQIVPIRIEIPYRELCIQIARFFKTRIAPVPLDETIEIFAFMQAAEESKRRGGQPVNLAEEF